jgi:trypsin
MKKINVLFATVFVLLLVSQSGATSRIVGGVESDITKHPYVVSIQRTSGSHFCGGSLIAPKFVLSAGHCVIGSADKMKIVIGSQSNSASASTAEVHKVVKITRNPDYDSNAISHDYSVWELDKPSKFEPVALTESLSDPHHVAIDNESMTLGWGTTSESGSLSKTLMEVKVPLVSTEDCKAAYPDQIDETMICAGLKEGGKDSCQGDSGGPLVVNDADGKEVLVGVVSWGEGCARPDKYGVYSDVGFAREWIDGILSLDPETLMASR